MQLSQAAASPTSGNSLVHSDERQINSMSPLFPKSVHKTNQLFASTQRQSSI
jgi:hypothetical protein